MSLKRPNDKIVYAPLRHQFERNALQRQIDLNARRQASTVRPEKKKNGYLRPQ